MRNTSRNFTARGLRSVELLEDRRVLAGNVLASLDTGDLIVRGDLQSNQIEITQVGIGAFQVRGLTGTRVNGNLTPVTISGVSDDIFIDMHQGNDTVTIRNLFAVPDTLTIGDLGVLGDVSDLGNDVYSISNSNIGGDLRVTDLLGDNSLTITNVNVGNFGVNDDLRVTLGSGSDRVTLLSVNIADDVLIATGAGADTVSITNGAIEISQGANSSSINLGSENDRLTISGTRLGNPLPLFNNVGLNVNGGTNDDSVTLTNVKLNYVDLKVDLGSGNNIATVDGLELRDDSFFDTNVRFESGSGNDVFTLRRISQNPFLSVFGDNFDVFSGDGHDTVTIFDLSLGNTGFGTGTINIDTASGNDRVTMDLVVADFLFATLGSGNDILTTRNVTADSAKFDGGAGTDRHIKAALNIGLLTVFDFEL